MYALCIYLRCVIGAYERNDYRKKKKTIYKFKAYLLSNKNFNVLINHFVFVKD